MLPLRGSCHAVGVTEGVCKITLTRRGELCVKSNMVYNCVRTWYTHYVFVTTSKFYDLSVCLTRCRIPRF